MRAEFGGKKESPGAAAAAQCSRKINFVQKIEIMIVTKQQKTGEHVENQKFYLVSD